MSCQCERTIRRSKQGEAKALKSAIPAHGLSRWSKIVQYDSAHDNFLALFPKHYVVSYIQSTTVPFTSYHHKRLYSNINTVDTPPCLVGLNRPFMFAPKPDNCTPQSNPPPSPSLNDCQLFRPCRDYQLLFWHRLGSLMAPHPVDLFLVVLSRSRTLPLLGLLLTKCNPGFKETNGWGQCIGRV
jgi:hypothetical protein